MFEMFIAFLLLCLLAPVIGWLLGWLIGLAMLALIALALYLAITHWLITLGIVICVYLIAGIVAARNALMRYNAHRLADGWWRRHLLRDLGEL
jgi:ABC-type antimicrobial peptide transport system permease subunit